MNAEQAAVAEQHANKGEQHVEVQVVTTSGTFPTEGSHRAPANQPVEIVLKQAQKKLEIADTEGWIATVSNTEIDPNKSYAECGLKGGVKIDWGPKEGGGGKAECRHA